MNGAARVIGAAFTVAIVCALGLAVTYLLGGQPQVEGVLLAGALGGIGIGLILWGKRLLPERVVEERLEASAPAVREAADEAIAGGAREIGRRRLLVRLLLGALGAMGVAALFPIRSLGPRPGRSLFVTGWRPGARVVDGSGRPIAPGGLVVGSVVTVFPEGAVGSADSQAVLIKVEPDVLQLDPERMTWAPDGHLAYSKVCTHAGCPVGLYDREEQRLVCPCHQSTFDVLRGAEPVSGPAVRALPQLPLELDPDGFLRARSDFTEPVGPGFWDRPED